MNELYPDSFAFSLPLKIHQGSFTTPLPNGNLNDRCARETLNYICLAACTTFSTNVLLGEILLWLRKTSSGSLKSTTVQTFKEFSGTGTQT